MAPASLVRQPDGHLELLGGSAYEYGDMGLRMAKTRRLRLRNQTGARTDFRRREQVKPLCETPVEFRSDASVAHPDYATPGPISAELAMFATRGLV